jgi:glycerophosphoryl diester phosphodiesterase
MANTVKINSGNTKMVAHQGLFGLERGNTNLAFVAAGNREKYFGIETDVHRTADGKYVCIHDSNTVSVSGVDMDVESSTFDELRSVRLKDVIGIPGRVDVRIPSLEEYIGICHYYGKVSVLELKTPFTPEQVKEIIDIIDGLGHLQDTIFISFHKCDIEAVRQYLPDHRAQFLTCAWNDDVKQFVTDMKCDIDICYPPLTKEAFDEMKAMGLEVNIWTVDDPALAEKYVSWGADYITSNILE